MFSRLSFDKLLQRPELRVYNYMVQAKPFISFATAMRTHQSFLLQRVWALNQITIPSKDVKPCKCLQVLRVFVVLRG